MGQLILNIFFVMIFGILAYLAFRQKDMLRLMLSLFCLFGNLYIAIVRIEKIFCK